MSDLVDIFKLHVEYDEDTEYDWYFLITACPEHTVMVRGVVRDLDSNRFDMFLKGLLIVTQLSYPSLLGLHSGGTIYHEITKELFEDFYNVIRRGSNNLDPDDFCVMMLRADEDDVTFLGTKK